VDNLRRMLEKSYGYWSFLSKVTLEGLGLKVELIFESRGCHRGLILGATLFLFIVGLRDFIAACSMRSSWVEREVVAIMFTLFQAIL